MDIPQKIIKFMWKVKRTTVAKIILEKKKVGGLTISEYETHHAVTVNTTVWCWCQGDT